MPSGPLHPLLIPDQHGDSIAIDFISLLPKEEGCDCIITFTDHLNSDIHLVASRSDLTVEELAIIFFDEWYCENGLLLNIVSNQDKLFTSKFWAVLHNLTRVKLKMSSAYHPQSDGTSEQTNKMINQCVRFHVDCTQQGWKRALPRIHFNLMNTVNTSTGFSPFQLHMSHSPHIIPPLVVNDANKIEDICALDIIKCLEDDINEAKDNLTMAKISQSIQVNYDHTENFPLSIDDCVLLSTLNCHHEFKQKGEKRVAKFMPCFNGPYVIMNINHIHSTVTLDLPNNPHVFLTFHFSQIIPFIENNPSLFPSRELTKPPPVIIDDEEEEFFIDRIIAEHTRGRGMQYLVRWTGYSPEEDRWLPTLSLKDCEALDVWLAQQKIS